MKFTHPLKKSIFAFTLALSGLFGFSQISQAAMCPAVGSIISGDPAADETVTYLSPGWSSDRVPMIDLNKATFAYVYADALGMKCIYDTNQGYLVLYSNDDLKINIPQVINDSNWYCTTQQGPASEVTTETVCTCDESLEACGFSWQ